MNMIMRMAARKHDSPLASATITVTLDRAAVEGSTVVHRVECQGPLSEARRRILLASLAHCPARTTLSKSLHFTAEIT